MPHVFAIFHFSEGAYYLCTFGACIWLEVSFCDTSSHRLAPDSLALLQHNRNRETSGISLFFAVREEALSIAAGAEICELDMFWEQTRHQELVAVRRLEVQA